MRSARRQDRTTLRAVVALLACVSWCASCASHAAEVSPAEHAKSATSEPRPTAWATPLRSPGVPNLHRMTPTLYRGAQPTEEGFRSLEAIGIKTVVSLRAFHSDRDLLGETGLGYERISFKAWHAEAEDVERFLRIVRDPARQPVFFHCQHGADRTGTMAAVYRIVEQGWTKDEAITEMKDGGFGFHAVWVNLIHYVRNFDASRVSMTATRSGRSAVVRLARQKMATGSATHRDIEAARP